MPLTAAQVQEVRELQKDRKFTRRAVVEAMEQLLYEALPVLDHGFIRVIDYMGDDAAIVQAARVSYGKGTKQISQDQGLINYLMRHRHTSPFEMCEIKLHVKMPVFVARQWIRHRTANVNEYSARYSILDREFYIPKQEHLAAQAKTNRQGRADVMEGAWAQQILDWLKQDAAQCYEHYEAMLNEDASGEAVDPSKPGLARELARMNLPVNIYTQWYWKTDLHNLLHFMSLRADAHAQYEIRAYADELLKIVKDWVPYTYEAFCKYRMGAAEISSTGLQVIRRLLRGEQVTQEDSHMSPGEWRELMAVLEKGL